MENCYTSEVAITGSHYSLKKEGNESMEVSGVLIDESMRVSEINVEHQQG